MNWGFNFMTFVIQWVEVPLQKKQNDTTSFLMLHTLPMHIIFVTETATCCTCAGSVSAFMCHISPPMSPLCFAAVSLALHVALAIASNDNTVTLPETSQTEYPKAQAKLSLTSSKWVRMCECVYARICLLPSITMLPWQPRLCVLCPLSLYRAVKGWNHLSDQGCPQAPDKKKSIGSKILSTFSMFKIPHLMHKNCIFCSYLIQSFYDIYECVTYRTPWCVCFVFQLVSIHQGRLAHLWGPMPL